MNLVNLFSCGVKVKALVNSVIQLQSPVYNILSHIVSIRNKILLSSNDMEKSAWEVIAVKLLRKYFLLIAVGIYLHETQDQEEKESFIQWMTKLSTVFDLYQSITTHHIAQYLSVYGDDTFHVLNSELLLGTSGYERRKDVMFSYLNVHTLLLLQQVIDQESNVFAKKLLLSLQTKENVFGTIYTKHLNMKQITQSWRTTLPKHLYLINIHRSPSMFFVSWKGNQ